MIAITGAGGHLGRAVTAALLQRVPPSSVALGSRDPTRLVDQERLGCRVVRADFDQPEHLDALFAGAKVVLLICGTASNTIRMRQHRDAIDAARRAGVERIAYTSFVNPHPGSLFPFAAVHADTENHLRESGVGFTLLRNNHYFDNLNAALHTALATGRLALPGAAGKVAYLSRADIGAATANVLSTDGHDNREYELTGATALDLYEVADMATAAWGRSVNAEEMGVDEYRTLLQERGLPPFAVDAQIGIRLAAGAGEYRHVTDDAGILAGRALETMEHHLQTISSSRP